MPKASAAPRSKRSQTKDDVGLPLLGEVPVGILAPADPSRAVAAGGGSARPQGGALTPALPSAQPLLSGPGPIPAPQLREPLSGMGGGCTLGRARSKVRCSPKA